MIDRERFRTAVLCATKTKESGFLGIGRLAEKALHRTLKLYYEPDESKHEIECEGSVADVKNEWGITEIQRSNLAYMKRKLDRFLPAYRVRLVHPIVARKRVRWLDTASGDISGTGRSILGKRVQDSAFEIYKIKDYIGKSGFSLVLLLLECDEYRLLDGYDATRRRGATKLEAIPRELIDEIEINSPRDCLKLLPDSLGDSFTEREFRAAVKSRSRYSYYTLRILCDLSLLTRRKEGNKYVYERLGED